ncbi:MAG: alpha-hydroxy-acid oxidizing protein [SAR202 cluster bacterium]|nr:alpha-hydroxy-acid oxidizing protein [SAR202 cluster bacterium]
MRLDDAINIEDLHKMAKRRLPKVAFDFIEGGLDDENGLDRNTAAFLKHRLLPRYLVDVSKRDQSKTIFGKTFNSPFGIAPTGGVSLFRRGGDMMLAEAAKDANIPYIMSGAAAQSLETAAKVAPRNSWYQLYAARDQKITEDKIRRTKDAGLDALVLTVDVPVGSNRERNIRNGFDRISGGWLKVAFTLKPRMLAEALTHPGWVMEYVRHGGTPMGENWQPYAPKGASASDVVKFSRSLGPFDSQTWKDLERYRRLFPRTLIVKGIMSPQDAIRCAEAGCDGVIVSNHGGRQLDQTPASLDVLPAIVAAVGDRMTVMLDSGVRRGADVLIALCLGAEFVFVGRPTLYGTVAGGLPGARKAVNILRREVDLVMAQIGCSSLDQLGPEFLWTGDQLPNLQGQAAGLTERGRSRVYSSS